MGGANATEIIFPRIYRVHSNAVEIWGGGKYTVSVCECQNVIAGSFHLAKF